MNQKLWVDYTQAVRELREASTERKTASAQLEAADEKYMAAMSTEREKARDLLASAELEVLDAERGMASGS